MRDVLYVLATIGFFLLMLAYIRGCQHLASDDSTEDPKP